ncbi:hypothetical protein SAMN05421813_13220 [Daejeonella rubra]|uniref:Haem-binding uptake, Tiki superfamily, ChaN n=1 Tax=Daejeonella rubra TaxID=990371 RepID=A0A1G9XUG4_9SPHI|nr:hypothetical protein [Daejeonella rubra]SDM99805.1 hypothetical protein SAMN05421813_13220 [Daejeonella rubra]
MKIKFYLAVIFIISSFTNPLFAQKTELLILPTIHGGHKKNVNYNFEHVRHIIENFKPDIIAVEIRPEDMDRDTSYLKAFYNPEMIMFKNEFPEAEKAGIDFMGADFEGKSLPPDFMKEIIGEFGKFRAMNQKLMRDTAIVKARIARGLPALISKRGEMMANLGANQLMDGKYDALTEEFTRGQTEVLKNTPYQFYDDFQVSRDQRIADNIKALALKNKGKRIIVLTGANHHNRAVNELRKVRSVNLVTQVQDH